MKEIEKILRQARDQSKLEYDFDIREVARRIAVLKYTMSNEAIDEYLAETGDLDTAGFIRLQMWLDKKRGENVW